MIRFAGGFAMILFFPIALSLTPQQKSAAASTAILIRKDRPSVYIEFEKKGKAPPLFQGETEERIWLRLHDNTPWAVEFCSLPVPKLLGDVGVVYDVKHIPITMREERFSNPPGSMNNAPPASQTQKETSAIPEGYSTGDTCTPYKLGSGRSISFSVPRDHLANQLFIEFEFWYEWENRDNELADYPQCLVSFTHDRLPKPTK